jgi:hypothetical protein
MVCRDVHSSIAALPMVGSDPDILRKETPFMAKSKPAVKLAGKEVAPPELNLPLSKPQIEVVSRVLDISIDTVTEALMYVTVPENCDLYLTSAVELVRTMYREDPAVIVAAFSGSTIGEELDAVQDSVEAQLRNSGLQFTPGAIGRGEDK